VPVAAAVGELPVAAAVGTVVDEGVLTDGVPLVVGESLVVSDVVAVGEFGRLGREVEGDVTGGRGDEGVAVKANV
jgi:hypothetical protein